MSDDGFPRVEAGTHTRSLRFSIPRIKFSPETLAAYEEGAGVSHASILERLYEIEPPEGPNAKQIRQKLESVAQGMLFYLANLWRERSRVGAVQPPLSHSMITHWRRKYPFFDDTCADFEEEMSDIAEDELFARAVVGVDCPVVVNGQVEWVVKKSDDLLKYYLTHNRPKRYSQKTEATVRQKTELSGPNGGPISLIDRTQLKGLSDGELAAMEEMLLKGVG